MDYRDFVDEYYDEYSLFEFPHDDDEELDVNAMSKEQLIAYIKHTHIFNEVNEFLAMIADGYVDIDISFTEYGLTVKVADIKTKKEIGCLGLNYLCTEED